MILIHGPMLPIDKADIDLFYIHVKLFALCILIQARSSVVEHHLDMVVVGGSNPLVPTTF